MSGSPIRLTGNEAVEQPVRWRFEHSHDPISSTLTIAEGSEVCLLLRDSGEGTSELMVTLEKDSSLHLIRLQQSAEKINTSLVVSQQSGSKMTTHYISFGGEETHNIIDIRLSEARAEHKVRGLAMTEGSERVSNEVRMTHVAPECSSNQLFKNIVADRSAGSFTGRIVVNQKAQKTSAYQRSSNLLLHAGARMHVEPQLEIYADDVQCSHGATTGQLDDEALFYLRSRGIELHEAQQMLLYAFAAEIISDISCQKAKNEVLKIVDEKWIT